MLRITGGELKGRRIQAPPGLATRPTGEKMRQALFNILGQRVRGARVADLFAGSGALGLEALSRGAAWCLFVENSRPAGRVLRANLAALGLESKGRLLAADAGRSRAKLKAAGPFDLVLADPPYEKGQVAKVLELCQDPGLLGPEGLLVVEHSPRERPLAQGALHLDDQRVYGQSELSFVSRQT